MVLCKCKYRSEPVGRDVIEGSVRRSALVKSSLPRELKVFSRSGYTDGAVEAAELNDITLLILEDESS